jgi:hypothetical protein
MAHCRSFLLFVLRLSSGHCFCGHRCRVWLLALAFAGIASTMCFRRHCRPVGSLPNCRLPSNFRAPAYSELEKPRRAATPAIGGLYCLVLLLFISWIGRVCTPGIHTYNHPLLRSNVYLSGHSDRTVLFGQGSGRPCHSCCLVVICFSGCLPVLPFFPSLRWCLH